MTRTKHLACWFLKGIAITAAMETTTFAQTGVQVTTLPRTAVERPPVDLLSQQVTTSVPNQVSLTGLGDGLMGTATRPQDRLTFAGVDGYHFSFVTPSAPREAEQLRVQSSLALLSAYLSQQNASRAARGPAETPGAVNKGAAR